MEPEATIPVPSEEERQDRKPVGILFAEDPEAAPARSKLRGYSEAIKRVWLFNDASQR